MPNPLSIAPATLTSLKVNPTDAVKFQLLMEKTPGNPAQVVNLQTFATRYMTTDDKVMAVLQALEASDSAKITYAPFTITWSMNPTINTTAAQIQADWNNGFLDDPSYYVYLALALTKGAAMIQTIDPAVFAAPPWNVTSDVLVAEIQKFATRRATVANPNNTPPFDVDYGDVTVTWIAANLGNAAQPTTESGSTTEAPVPSGNVTAPIPQTFMRINCGGQPCTDAAGNEWESDSQYVSNAVWQYTTNEAIAVTPDQLLYQSQRYGGIFQIALPNGNYQIKLYSCEIWNDAIGQRVFDVLINRQVSLEKWDIFQEAQGKFRPISRTVNSTVNNELLVIEFNPHADQPALSAIEIIKI